MIRVIASRLMKTPGEPQINGPALRAIRQALDIPGARMADDLGLSRGYLHDIETGRYGCRAAVIRAMASYLNVAPAAICRCVEPAA